MTATVSNNYYINYFKALVAYQELETPSPVPSKGRWLPALIVSNKENAFHHIAPAEPTDALTTQHNITHTHTGVRFGRRYGGETSMRKRPQIGHFATIPQFLLSVH